jgi:3'(2'), 5'-bisphosphate nucleotidase
MSNDDRRRAPIDRVLMDALTAILSRAGCEILKLNPATIARRIKDDRSPVSIADEVANEIILKGLSKLLPSVPVVSEEAVARVQSPGLPEEFVLVDPLDGTKEFLEGRTDFTLNIAVIRNRRPVAGAIFAPALQTLWRGIVSHGAERLHLVPGTSGNNATAIHVRQRPPEALIAAVSHSHFDERTAAFVEALPIKERIECGSSIKFCRIAGGEADIYPRLAPTHEWDIAAGHAILEAAGGAVTTPDGMPLFYGNSSEGFIVPSFVAWGDPQIASEFKVGLPVSGLMTSR